MPIKDLLKDTLPPRVPVEIEEELASLERIEKAFRESDVSSAAIRFNIESIGERQIELQEELRAAKLILSDYDFEFSIEGKPVKNHMIIADFFGRLLKNLQEMANRVFSATGTILKMGEKIPESCLLDSQIMVAGWSSSSFTVHFRLNPLGSSGDFLVPERRKIMFENLYELFSEDISEEELTTLITRSSSKVAYMNLLTDIANQDVVIKLRTKAHPYCAKLGAEVAAERAKWMELPEKETEDFIKVTGILVGGNIDTHTFTVKTKDISYSGRKISQDAQDQIKKIKLGAWVNAIVKQIAKYKTKASSEPIITYTLESIFESTEKEETMSLF